MPYQTVKGTYDQLPSRLAQCEELEGIFRLFLDLYGYRLMKTPVIEYAGVFQKENDTSDMVTKEMFTFSMNEKDRLTLRPEGTAGIIRSVIENKLYGKEELPLKLAYIEEMFRHERPQKGRQRQFTQLGLENIGVKSPLVDAEVIALGYSFIKALGLQGVKVLINTLGDSASRLAYSEALRSHFASHLDELCTDCQKRYEKNPLRILDCKIDHELEAVQNAPKLSNYLSEESKGYFEKVLTYLDALEIPYQIDEKLVRGLDYYTDTVFEVVSTNPASGSQATLFAGGRYDELVKEMGGPELSGIGFAMGEERILLAMEAEGLLKEEPFETDCYLIDLTNGSPYVLKLATMLRAEGYRTVLNVQPRSIKAQFKSADRVSAPYVLIIGEDEEKKETVQMRVSATKEQKELAYGEVVDFLNKAWEEKDV
ncbi:MAG: histidine--tRNA ligase [Erysipelotrichaceae bacterium]|nr:histidine--tRNA ligase [Erysipelotrichaceae bacterium]